MSPATALKSVLLLLAVAVTLGGCKDVLTGQPLIKEKGVYQGPQNLPLTEAELKELRQRVLLQSRRGI